MSIFLNETNNSKKISQKNIEYISNNLLFFKEKLKKDVS